MWNLARYFNATTRLGLVCLAAATGCAQVAGIDDWSETSSSGGSGGDSTSSTGQAGNGTGGSMGGVEICDNGGDEDADGQVDCADSDCGGYACVPLPPTGWQGPVEVLEGDMLPPCPDGWAASSDMGTGQLTAPDPVCSPCSCGLPGGGGCELDQDAYFYTFDGSCTNVATGYPVGGPDLCHQLINTTGVTQVKLHAGVILMNGSCTPAGGNAVGPEPSFEQNARACQPPSLGEGCAADAACMPRPVLPGNASLCIYAKAATALACPAEYPLRRELNAITQDTRGCSACTCDSPNGQWCSLDAVVYTDGACGMWAAEVPPLTCTTVSPVQSFQVRVDGPLDGECAPAGGQLMGELVVEATTVCCQ
jgi:hypothetical protein